MKAQIRAQAAPWRDGVELYIGSDDLRTRVKEILLERTEENVCVAPSFVLSNQNAQTLMDDLWNSGFRPTEGSGSAGALRATERHLEDMRTLVFRRDPADKMPS